MANLALRELSAFCALAEQRSFTRAAADCHLSQPAFSALVKALEETVGGAPVRPHLAQAPRARRRAQAGRPRGRYPGGFS